MVPAGISELETAQKLLEHHRNIVRILPLYPKILKVISADQPCVDVFYQGKPCGQQTPQAFDFLTPGAPDPAVPASRVCPRAWESSHRWSRLPAGPLGAPG